MPHNIVLKEARVIGHRAKINRIYTINLIVISALADDFNYPYIYIIIHRHIHIHIHLYIYLCIFIYFTHSLCLNQIWDGIFLPTESTTLSTIFVLKLRWLVQHHLPLDNMGATRNYLDKR